MMALKSNRKVALSVQDKSQRRYQTVSTLDLHARFRVLPPAPHGFDGNNDNGVGCFDGLWDGIINSIVTDGRFAGQFFGVRDSWAVNTEMTFHTEEQVRAMLERFEIESFHEQNEDGHATSGPKHWHVFTVVAKKR